MKEALARYYESVAEWILPELRNRPLCLVLAPRGCDEGSFYQRHVDEAWSDEIARVPIPESDGEGLYAVANSADAVAGLVRNGVIELHVWGATTRDLDQPDRMVFDLDPAEGVAWREVMAAARATRDRLADLGLDSYVKTSGGKGLHVAVPLAPKHEWGEVREFSRALAEAMSADDPRLFTSKTAKRGRVDRIFIDYLRNVPGATMIAAYSARAHDGAPVSTPLHWDEIGGRMKARSFHTANVPRRLQGLHTDPWKAFRRKPQTLTAAMKRKLGIEP
jgi:bifunctional non-homologous end joining protein LigD